MSSNGTEGASADSERYEIKFFVVNHNFIRTTGVLALDIQQGMCVDTFFEAVLVKYPGVFNNATARLYHVPGGFSPTALKKVESEGWVGVSPMQTFTRDAEALHADSERWAKIPDDIRKVYYVIKPLAPAPVEAVGGDDEDLEWTVEKRLPLLCEQDNSALTSSSLAKTCPEDLHATKLYRFINYNCPRETESIPLVLLSEVFGQFKDDCNREPDSEMSQTLTRYAEAGIGMAEDLSAPVDEGLLMLKFDDRFEVLYGVRFTRFMYRIRSDGRLVRDGRLQLLRVLKSRNPGGDALVHGADDYRWFYVDHLKESGRLPDGDVLPAFLITCQGPLINVYGIACVEKGQVQTEYLTSVNAGCHWTNGQELYKLTRILYALRKALDRLDALPGLTEAPTSPPRKRQKMTRTRPAQTVWPYPRTFTKLGSDIDVEFRYLKRLDGERYLFAVQPIDKPSELLLVKFTQFYGRDVHEELARAGYAPELLGFSDLAGGWKMVVMELLKRSVWEDGTSLPDNDEIVRQGLSTVRNKILPLLQEKGYVHGDIRLSNLIFRTGGVGDDSDPAVKLVDFDYSGEAGKTTYPWNLNTTIRPQGQHPCAPLDFSHDNASLKMLEEEIGSRGIGAGLLVRH